MLRYIRMFLLEFYTDDGLIQSRCPLMLQDSFNKLVTLFEQVGLSINTAKTKTMTCIPGKIRTRLLDEAYTNSRDRLMDHQNWKRN